MTSSPMAPWRWRRCLCDVLMTSLILSCAMADIVKVSPEEQAQRIFEALLLCNASLSSAPAANRSTCEPIWDTILCWPETPAGTVAYLPCPDYVDKFNTLENASRQCMESGEWYVPPDSNTSWTDYTRCVTPPSNIKFSPLIASHMPRLRIMYNTGYGLSLVSLVLAVIIMLAFKRLHCARNTIHLNLFASFILRASVSFMKENLLVHGLAFPADLHTQPNGDVELTDGPHWQCKLFFVIFNYALAANYMWIFVEGLYLHMLLSVTVFNEKTGIKWYIVLGWVTPLSFVLPWVTVRAVLEDVVCWNTHPTPGYFWIMKGPITLSIAINFVFFLNILRILFTKLNAANSQEAKKFRYRKLAKSTLVLIPLFGIHYIVFLGLPEWVNETAELIKLYFEMFFNSIQGFFVALLFCFLNGEVQSEIKKKWHRFKLRRCHNFSTSRPQWNTYATYLSRPRGSINSNSNYGEPRDSEPANGSSRRVTEATSLTGERKGDKSLRGKLNGSANQSRDEILPMIELEAIEREKKCANGRAGLV